MTTQPDQAVVIAQQMGHISMLRDALSSIISGLSEFGPRVIADRALHSANPAPAAVVYQGYRGVVLKGGGRWEDLTKAQFDDWNTQGYETRTLFAATSSDPSCAVTLATEPTSDMLRIDWCVRMLEGIKEGGREKLGDAYPDIIQIVGALKRVMEPSLDTGPEEDASAHWPCREGWQWVPAALTPEMVCASGADVALAATTWKEMLARAPQPAPSTRLRSPDLTERKTNDIVSRGYKKVGYVLVNNAGEFCISAQSAVRWLPQAHYWRLMHEQNSRLFAPLSESVIVELAQSDDEKANARAHLAKAGHVPMVSWTLSEAYQQGWADRSKQPAPAPTKPVPAAQAAWLDGSAWLLSQIELAYGELSYREEAMAQSILRSALEGAGTPPAGCDLLMLDSVSTAVRLLQEWHAVPADMTNWGQRVAEHLSRSGKHLTRAILTAAGVPAASTTPA